MYKSSIRLVVTASPCWVLSAASIAHVIPILPLLAFSSFLFSPGSFYPTPVFSTWGVLLDPAPSFQNHPVIFGNVGALYVIMTYYRLATHFLRTHRSLITTLSINAMMTLVTMISIMTKITKIT